MDLEVDDLGDAAVGQHHTAVDVPVCTLTFEMPRGAGRQVVEPAGSPSRYARSSAAVEFSLPTSPISPPTLTVTPSASSDRISAMSSAARCSSSLLLLVAVGLDRSTSVDESMSMLR